MAVIGKNPYRFFKSCSFIPYFDSEPLERPNDVCICEPTHPSLRPSTSSSSSSSSGKRATRGKSSSSKGKTARNLSVPSLLDFGFSEWAKHTEDNQAKKQDGRANKASVSRRRSDRSATTQSTESFSESGRQNEKEHVPFKYYADPHRYMEEYRGRHSQKLVGYDGTDDPEYLTMGENIPDPYIFKTVPFKRAYEFALQHIFVRGQNHTPTSLNVQKSSTSQNGPYPSLTKAEPRSLPSTDVKPLRGLTGQTIFPSNLDTVCASMKHVGQDTFMRLPPPPKRSTPTSRRSLVSRQSRAESEPAEGKLELAITHTRLASAMRDRLSNSANAENSQPLRDLSSKSSPRSHESPMAGMAMPNDPEEATKTMLMFLQRARLDVDKSRDRRKLQDSPKDSSSRPKSLQDGDLPTNKKQFTAVLCKDGGGSTRTERMILKQKSKNKNTIGGQLQNGRLKTKVFRPSLDGDIKLEDALKAGRVHVTVGQGV